MNISIFYVSLMFIHFFSFVLFFFLLIIFIHKFGFNGHQKYMRITELHHTNDSDFIFSLSVFFLFSLFFHQWSFSLLCLSVLPYEYRDELYLTLQARVVLLSTWRLHHIDIAILRLQNIPDTNYFFILFISSLF